MKNLKKKRIKVTKKKDPNGKTYTHKRNMVAEKLRGIRLKGPLLT